jgi:hypothetical protein
MTCEILLISRDHVIKTSGYMNMLLCQKKKFNFFSVGR